MKNNHLLKCLLATCVIGAMSQLTYANIVNGFAEFWDTIYYHTPNRNGAHGFLYSLTAVGLFGDNIFSQILDCINPISDIVDGLDLIDEYLNDYDE